MKIINTLETSLAKNRESLIHEQGIHAVLTAEWASLQEQIAHDGDTAEVLAELASEQVRNTDLSNELSTYKYQLF